MPLYLSLALREPYNLNHNHHLISIDKGTGEVRAQGIIPSRKCISQGQMISNHVEYFTWFDMIIEMRVSFYKNQII